MMPKRGLAVLRLLLAYLLLACLLLFMTGCAGKNNPGPAMIANGGTVAVEGEGGPDRLDDLDNDDWWEEEWEVVAEEYEPLRVADPLEGWNRAMFTVNDKLYLYLLKPVAQAYAMVVPELFRIGIGNFFTNLAYPVRAVNSLLQGKGDKVAKETGSFVLNTTFGFLGLVKISDAFPVLNVTHEDAGQTFGVWGIGNGPYIVWPLLGPSTLRDSVGMTGDFFLSPLSYLEPHELGWALKAHQRINSLSFRIGQSEDMKVSAIDPYVAFRDAYIQYRHALVQD